MVRRANVKVTLQLALALGV